MNINFFVGFSDLKNAIEIKSAAVKYIYTAYRGAHNSVHNKKMFSGSEFYIE